MFDFTDEQKMVRNVVRKWVLANLSPAVDRLESEETLPYDLMRGFIKTFGIDEMARAAMKKLEARQGDAAAAKEDGDDDSEGGGVMRDPAMGAIVGIEFSRVSPGFAMAF